MTVLQIHVQPSPGHRASTQFVTLDGIRVGIRTRYSSREQRWYLWLLAPDSRVITGPIKLVPGLDLLAGKKHDPRVPPGQLFVHSVQRKPPTTATVDVEARLLYREAPS